jgi:hypothetical protein
LGIQDAQIARDFRFDISSSNFGFVSDFDIRISLASALGYHEEKSDNGAITDQFMAKSSPNSFFGWLGRQVGHVKKAVKTDVTAPKVIYRNDKVEEQAMPDQPGVKLRRTTIDEVIVDPNQKKFENR